MLLNVLSISNYLEIKAKEVAQSVTMHYAPAPVNHLGKLGMGACMHLKS